MQILRAGALYFTLAFAAGFVFGAIRVLWAVPRFGEKVAELMEAPLMLAVIVLAARWIVRRMPSPASGPRRLGIGLVALTLLLAAELLVVLRLRGLTIGDYIASREPVAGAAYVAMLVAYTAMPLIVCRRTGRPDNHSQEG